MYERNAVAGSAQGLCCKDPLEDLTCGQNLERKIEEQKKRLADLESAKAEMLRTGLYDVKIGTLRDTMSY